MVLGHSIFEEKHLFLENIFFPNVFIHLIHSSFQVLCMILFNNKVKDIYLKVKILLLIALA